MKRLFIYFIVVILLTACTNDTKDQVYDSVSANQDILEFKSVDDFLETYNLLSTKISKNEVDEWINLKGFKNSLFKELNSKPVDTVNLVENENNIEKFSDAFKAILNTEFQFKISNEIIELSENGDLINKKDGNAENENLIFGKITLDTKIFEEDKLNSSEKVFNNNSTYTFYKEFFAPYGTYCNSSGTTGGDRQRRFVSTLFSETIIQNNSIISQKLFLRLSLEAKYRSFWKTKWTAVQNEAVGITVSNLKINTLGDPNKFPTYNVNGFCYTNSLIYMLGDFSFSAPYQFNPLPQTIFLSGTIIQTHYSSVQTNFTYNRDASIMN